MGMKNIVIISALLMLVSCGKNPLPWNKDMVAMEAVEPAQAEMYSYELGNRDCSTGKHSFHTFVEVCHALLDNELNNHCVEEERLELHKSNCEASSNS